MNLNLWQFLSLAGIAGLVALSRSRSPSVPLRAPDPMVFEKISPKGISFATNSGSTSRKYQPQTMLGGVALFDYNNDGLLDIYLVNGATMPGLLKEDQRYYNRLFRNNGDGSFTDVTEAAGVRGRGYDFGVAVDDYDNDGLDDIFVMGLPSNILYHNNGDGTLTDVTSKAGLNIADPQYGPLWALGAAWVDFGPGRVAGPFRLKLRCLGPKDRTCLRARRGSRLLPSKCLQRAARLAISQ